MRLDSDLDRDLALYSLSRAELLLRLDRAFKVQLPERLIGEANSPKDLVKSNSLRLPRDRRDASRRPTADADLGKSWRSQSNPRP